MIPPTTAPSLRRKTEKGVSFGSPTIAVLKASSPSSTVCWSAGSGRSSSVIVGAEGFVIEGRRWEVGGGSLAVEASRGPLPPSTSHLPPVYSPSCPYQPAYG